MSLVPASDEVVARALEGYPVPDMDLPFNRESVALQEQLGIDPVACLKIGIVPGHERTIPPIYFGNLVRGIWVSPEGGTWRDHDETFHWPGVQELLPAAVPLVKHAGRVGISLIQAGEAETANDLSWAIDFFIDKFRREDHRTRLIRFSCFPESEVPSYDVINAHSKRVGSARLAFIIKGTLPLRPV